MSDDRQLVVKDDEPAEASTELVPRIKETMIGKHYLGTISESKMTLEEFERERRGSSAGKKAKRKHTGPGSAASIDGYRGSWGEPNTQPVVAGPTAEELAQFLTTRAHEQQYQPEVTKIRSIKAGQEHSVWHGWSHDPDLKTVLDQPVSQVTEEQCKTPRRLLHCWTGHTHPVQVIRMLGENLLVSGGHDAQVKLWSAKGEPWECLRTFYGHNKPIRDVALDATHMVTLSHERTVQRWDIEEGILDCSLPLECQPMACVVKDSSLLVATVEGVVKEWDTRQGSWVRQFGIPRITERRKKRVKKLRQRGEEVSEEEEEYNPKQGHDGPISCISQLGEFVITAGEDRTVRLWDLRNEVEAYKTIELDYLPTAMLVHENTICLQSASNAIHTLEWDSGILRSGRRTYTGHRTDGHACQMAISPDGRWLASGSADGKLVMWDWRSGQLSRRLDAHERAMHGVQWNPRSGSSRVATCSWDGSIKYWE